MDCLVITLQSLVCHSQCRMGLQSFRYTMSKMRLLRSVNLRQGRPAMMPDFQKDYDAGRRLLSDNGLPVFEAPIHLEGGSIHSDGQGTMVVTEECLLDPSRNPELGREGIEQV